MSRGDPVVIRPSETRRAARPEGRAADRDRHDEDARLEVQGYARALAQDAYYATRTPARGTIVLSAAQGPMTRSAALLAQGMTFTRVRTHLYRATHAWVCLDCDWVGAFDEDEVDQTVERDAHVCSGEGSA